MMRRHWLPVLFLPLFFIAVRPVAHAASQITSSGSQREYSLSADDRVLSGSLDVVVAAADLQKASLVLDLPLGWSGKLSADTETKEVFDIGWPSIDFTSPVPNSIKCSWLATAPANVQTGDFAAQVRVDYTDAKGEVTSNRNVFTIHVNATGGELPKSEGWSRRVPYDEPIPGQFNMPRAAATLAGAELVKAMQPVLAVDGHEITNEKLRAAFLENVEKTDDGWRLAEKPYRAGILSELPSANFAATCSGERIIIRDERLIGSRFIGIQFGYGPENGIVGIRDCEGRLVATQDLHLDKPATFAQFLWIALPVGSRDGWIYVESLGKSRSSAGQKFSIQRVMIFNEDDPSKLFR